MIPKYLMVVLPKVNHELDSWQNYAKENMHGELQKQALASIEGKRFHCQGGNFYSLYPGVCTQQFIRFVVALQTISDYLDNLCDRVEVLDGAAFRQLHLAMTDALNPQAEVKDYYALYAYQEDGGYLRSLVVTCQRILGQLPSYDLVKKEMLHLATLYSELQTYKHIAKENREQAMLDWLDKVNQTGELSHWEFAAATGSTLGMFMLAALAYQRHLQSEDVERVVSAYFPWICALHIQLDYFIDQAEDNEHGDLNFISYYANQEEIKQRLCLIYQNAYKKAKQTKESWFAKTIVQGLPALYLSDKKIKQPAQQAVRDELLHTAGCKTRGLYYLCKILRCKKIL